MTDHRLNLPRPPLRPVGMGDEHPGSEDRIHVAHNTTASAVPLDGHSGAPAAEVPSGTGEVHTGAADTVPRAVASMELAATLASRICHDLVSPIGAIANGVELLTLSGAQRSPELDLIAESVQSATARLRFFRLAYGMSGPQGIGRAEVTRTLADVSKGSRFRYDWQAEGEPSRDEIRAVFLLIQCIEAALPLGGQIRITCDDGRWEVTAEGRRVRHDLPALAALVRGEDNRESGSALIQFQLLHCLLAELERNLVLSATPEGITASF